MQRQRGPDGDFLPRDEMGEQILQSAVRRLSQFGKKHGQQGDAGVALAELMPVMAIKRVDGCGACEGKPDGVDQPAVKGQRQIARIPPGCMGPRDPARFGGCPSSPDRERIYQAPPGHMKHFRWDAARLQTVNEAGYVCCRGHLEPACGMAGD